MPTAFQSYALSLAPTWLQGPFGQGYMNAIGALFDGLVDREKLANKADMPLVAPPDGLARIGSERGLPRGNSETDASFATRLQNAWNTWLFAGTARGVLRALYDAGYPNTATVQQLGTVYTLDANQNAVATGSPRWTFDNQSPPSSPTVWAPATVYGRNVIVVPSPSNGFFYESVNGGTSAGSQPAFPTTVGATIIESNQGIAWCCRGRDFWSRFAVMFFTPFPASWSGVPPAYGSAEVSRIRGLINQWKPAFSTCVEAIAISAGRVLGFPAPLRTLGGGNGTIGGAASTVWTPV